MQVGASQYMNNMNESTGIRYIMQPLSLEEKMTLQSNMQDMPIQDRRVAVEAMKQVDPKSLNGADYFQALLNTTTTVASQSMPAPAHRSIKLFSVYA
jgi:hypothetical protein